MSQPSPHVLLIEDEHQIRRFLRMALEAEGITVAEADSGRRGLAEIACRCPDLLILDLGLPDMDGVDLIGHVRASANVPIIILSARSDEAQKVVALDAGADDYLTKPFGSAELMARIRVHLRRRSRATVAPGVAQFEFGEVTVDFARRRVSRAGQTVHLTPIEYKLLTVLAMNADRVMTHTQLLREVWGSGRSERHHYLRIYMGHLRQKLERDAARPAHIVTETGVGYRLVGAPVPT